MHSFAKSIVLGTAGHIDHGKTALLKSLTGVDADRLKEEKERGITIDIGFAPWVDPPYRIGFIDVPGHEKFVKNMLAGAGGIAGVLLVVAADEGVMPQTREHFEIIRLLGITDGVIALTKCDLVAEEYQELAEDDVRHLVRGSFLETAPVIRTSAVTGQGLAELRAALHGLADRITEPSAGGTPRLFIDRVFVIRGFGTVATGTVLSGAFRRNDRVAILPEGREAKIRHIEVYEQEVEEARAGERAALNLAGLEPADLRRGQAVTAPDCFTPAQIFYARFHLLESFGRAVKAVMPVHVYHGSAELLGRLQLLDRPHLEPGASALVQIRLESPALVWPGDHLVVRQYSPLRTMGGGRVLEIHAARYRAREGRRVQARLARLEGAGDAARVREAVDAREDTGVAVTELVNLTGLPAARVTAMLADAPAGDLLPLTRDGAAWIGAAAAGRLRGQILQRMEEHDRRNPYAHGIKKQELRSLFPGMGDETFAYLIRSLQAEGKIDADAERLMLAGRKLEVESSLAGAIAGVEDSLRRSGVEGLTDAALHDLLARAGRAEASAVDFLLKSRRLVRVGPDFYVHPDTLAEVVAALRGRLAKGDPLEVGLFKELFGLTRKRAIPLLEYLDRQGVTRRVGTGRYFC